MAAPEPERRGVVEVKRIEPSGRVNARRPWKPLGCGVDACASPAAVALCTLLAAHPATLVSLGSELRPCAFGVVNEGRRVGLCAGHWIRLRPGVDLPALGWGERLAGASVEVSGSEVGKGGAHGAPGSARNARRGRGANAAAPVAVTPTPGMAAAAESFVVEGIAGFKARTGKRKA
jgi:hypothetical protein